MKLFCAHWWGCDTMTVDEEGNQRFHKRCSWCGSFWYFKEDAEPKIQKLYTDADPSV